MTQIMIPVSVGELVDKITILEIKNSLITHPDQLINIRRELTELRGILDTLSVSTQVQGLMDQLRVTNLDLWHIENYKRYCERDQEFGDGFVNAARQVYIKNDARAGIKRQINQLTGSDIVEEKSHSS